MHVFNRLKRKTREMCAWSCIYIYIGGTLGNTILVGTLLFVEAHIIMFITLFC